MFVTGNSPTGTVSHAGTARRLLNKVPEVTLYFWVIKILCTTVGETAADFLERTSGSASAGRPS